MDPNVTPILQPFTTEWAALLQLKRFSPRTARWLIGRGATAYSRRSPPSSYSCYRFCTATQSG
jgi:hypothetical protein